MANTLICFAENASRLIFLLTNVSSFCIAHCKSCSHFCRKNNVFENTLATTVNEFIINELVKPLQKHAYSTILENFSPKNENFQIKNSDIFHISAENIDCGTR